MPALLNIPQKREICTKERLSNAAVDTVRQTTCSSDSLNLQPLRKQTMNRYHVEHVEEPQESRNISVATLHILFASHQSMMKKYRLILGASMLHWSGVLHRTSAECARSLWMSLQLCNKIGELLPAFYLHTTVALYLCPNGFICF
ncbi:hypothetical protein EYF80_015833 [Liparis tanakae]|uniref:Uncharacterized protein n=1 Tax=Liparis tanakae TaxID=230148 RepID=A0A4Z2I9D5_9TELE|nr:hypothetical protein EYF80_015833 [Liparis tanakae]